MRSDGKKKIPASGFNHQCNFSHIHIYIVLGPSFQMKDPMLELGQYTPLKSPNCPNTW